MQDDMNVKKKLEHLFDFQSNYLYVKFCDCEHN